MHYGACAFSTCSSCSPLNPFHSGCFTIETRAPQYQAAIGNRDEMGEYDDDDLIAAYGAGTVHYVAPGGNFGLSGSIAHPWPLAYAVNEGGTLWLEGDDYEYTDVMSEPALLKAHGGNAVIGDF
jgi:hypothetical protein